MNLRDVKELKRDLDRYGKLDGNNEDIMDDAIFALEHGNDYRAEIELTTLAYNLERSGDYTAANMVKQVVR